MDFDSLLAADLRDRGSLKWTLFPDTIGAFIAEMDFGTAPEITAALHGAVDAGAFGYLPSALADALGEAGAAWQRERYGWEVAAADVHPIADVIAGLQLAIEHFSPAGAPVILPVPAYMPFLTVPTSMGRETITVPLADDGERATVDLDALDAAFAAGGRLLILCNPYNPVGRVFADEIHAPLVYPGHRHVPYASLGPVTAGHTVTATSASKAWNLPGLKCAQLIISNAPDAEVWERIGPMASHGAANLGVIANTTAYTAGRPWLDEVLAYLDGSRTLLAELVAEHLPGVGYRPPEGTYIGWLDCRELGLDAPADFFRERAGVALTDGVACGAPGFARIVFATPRPVLREAVAAMGSALRSR